MEINIIGNKSELYAGGGKWLTENKATCFPTFSKRRFLRPGESIEDFKEVTEAEKAALEKLRDRWTRPPQSFIDQWNAACGVWGKYNEGTGFFELNGLTDITYEEAVAIYQAGPLLGDAIDVFGQAVFNKIRTNLPATRTMGTDYYARFRKFYTQFSWGMEVVNLCSVKDVDELGVVYAKGVIGDNASWAVWSDYTFTSPVYIGVIDVRLTNARPDNTVGCGACRQLFIASLHTDCNMRSMRALELPSFQFLIARATNTSPITITVHSDVYAKLTDPDNPEWYALLDLAAEKNITFATTE